MRASLAGAVRCYGKGCALSGGQTLGVTRVVVGVHAATDRISINDASGLTGPDYGDVWTAPYDSASTTRREGLTPHAGAFFADAAGTLGAAGDPGREVL